ncbi:MAG TPA: hypothetical protein VHL53_02190 [Acidimicrobiia bacterium]|nr:hypothetical protein [Acidimicrobiia bacterium]
MEGGDTGAGAGETPAGRSFPVPGWRRHTTGEHRWPASLAIVVAAGLQMALPARLVLPPRYLLPGLELMLLIGLTAMDPGRIDRRERHLRVMGIGLIAVVAMANMVSATRLVIELLQSKPIADSAATLIVNGASVYLTNVIAFALWYWELDRGGPAARTHGVECFPDFLFPQMASPELAPPDWEPVFVDYLYVSFTNATAFSPTDVPPLTRTAKAAMALQSSVALGTLALVISRAINVLRQ